MTHTSFPNVHHIQAAASGVGELHIQLSQAGAGQVWGAGLQPGPGLQGPPGDEAVAGFTAQRLGKDPAHQPGSYTAGMRPVQELGAALG